jgi:hypothetical protein
MSLAQNLARKAKRTGVQKNDAQTVDNVQLTPFAARLPKIKSDSQDRQSMAINEGMWDAMAYNITVMQLFPNSAFQAQVTLKAFMKEQAKTEQVAKNAEVKKIFRLDYTKLAKVPKFWLAAWLFQIKLINEIQSERMDRADPDAIRDSVEYLCELESDDPWSKEMKPWDALTQALTLRMKEVGRFQDFRNALKSATDAVIPWRTIGPWMLHFDADNDRLVKVTHRPTNLPQNIPNDVEIRGSSWHLVDLAHDCQTRAEKENRPPFYFKSLYKDNEGPFLHRPNPGIIKDHLEKHLSLDGQTKLPEGVLEEIDGTAAVMLKVFRGNQFETVNEADVKLERGINVKRKRSISLATPLKIEPPAAEVAGGKPADVVMSG